MINDFDKEIMDLANELQIPLIQAESEEVINDDGSVDVIIHAPVLEVGVVQGQDLKKGEIDNA